MKEIIELTNICKKYKTLDLKQIFRFVVANDINDTHRNIVCCKTYLYCINIINNNIRKYDCVINDKSNRLVFDTTKIIINDVIDKEFVLSFKRMRVYTTKFGDDPKSGDAIVLLEQINQIKEYTFKPMDIYETKTIDKGCLF